MLLYTVYISVCVCVCFAENWNFFLVNYAVGK